jgi:CRP-like cAMP-binding protein
MLLRKLEQVMVLSETERQTISELPERVLHVKPREDIVDTSRPTSVRLIRTGIACRYTLLGNGHRQITAFLVPGDFCDLRALIMGDMDHAVSALGPCELAVVPHHRLFAAINNHPRLALHFGVTPWLTLRSIGIGWQTLVAGLPMKGWLIFFVKYGFG